jgi:hypothetical protein
VPPDEQFVDPDLDQRVRRFFSCTISYFTAHTPVPADMHALLVQRTIATALDDLPNKNVWQPFASWTSRAFYVPRVRRA